jgi:ABC-type lipoprotein export system ATPase subunit
METFSAICVARRVGMEVIMSSIFLKDVSYTYQTKYQKVDAVKEVTCGFERGKLYAITGESGSGKSTLLSLLAGLDNPTKGDIQIDGKKLREMDRDKYRRKDVSIIYQDIRLLPLMNSVENTILPMAINGVSKKERREKAIQYLEKAGVKEELYKKYPKMLSGGEQQRVAIARAMSNGGMIILADEPTGNLDSENEEKIVKMLLDLAHEYNYLVIVVTHSLEVASHADVVYKMKDGMLVAMN